jgi:hypothetical protein
LDIPCRQVVNRTPLDDYGVKLPLSAIPPNHIHTTQTQLRHHLSNPLTCPALSPIYRV